MSIEPNRLKWMLDCLIYSQKQREERAWRVQYENEGCPYDTEVEDDEIDTFDEAEPYEVCRNEQEAKRRLERKRARQQARQKRNEERENDRKERERCAQSKRAVILADYESEDDDDLLYYDVDKEKAREMRREDYEARKKKMEEQEKMEKSKKEEEEPPCPPGMMSKKQLAIKEEKEESERRKAKTMAKAWREKQKLEAEKEKEKELQREKEWAEKKEKIRLEQEERKKRKKPVRKGDRPFHAIRKKKIWICLIITMIIVLFCMLAVSCTMIGYLVALRKKPVGNFSCPFVNETEEILPGDNLTSQARATQSSGTNAALAIDGNYANLNMHGGTCSHTSGTDDYPWFCVKLQEMSLVEGIIIRTSITAPANSYDHLEIRIGNHDECNQDKKFTYNGICAWYEKNTKKKTLYVVEYYSFCQVTLMLNGILQIAQMASYFDWLLELLVYEYSEELEVVVVDSQTQTTTPIRRFSWGKCVLVFIILIMFICLAVSCGVIGYIVGTTGAISFHKHSGNESCPGANYTGPAFGAGNITITNLALTSTAKQSSGTDASLAVDGILASQNVEFCAFTLGKDKYPWLCVELKKMSMVQEIIIRTTVTVGLGITYDNLRVRVGNYQECFEDANFYRNNICGEYSGHNPHKPGEMQKFNCTPYDLVGKYVSVQIYQECKACVLSICEIEILGYPIDMK
uniref:Fucolectin tachylectin-4 pentraxin-1 domain-containing protein n=1 Tax=Strigamia maritima TaxID=126957 RepID=T1J0S5_STRMM